MPVFLEDFTVRCESALPAADLDVLLVRASRRTFDAALAAFFDVTLVGALRWDRALPPAVFDFAPVDFARSVFEAAVAARFLVTRCFAIVWHLLHGIVPRTRYAA